MKRVFAAARREGLAQTFAALEHKTSAPFVAQKITKKQPPNKKKRWKMQGQCAALLALTYCSILGTILSTCDGAPHPTTPIADNSTAQNTKKPNILLDQTLSGYCTKDGSGIWQRALRLEDALETTEQDAMIRTTVKRSRPHAELESLTTYVIHRQTPHPLVAAALPKDSIRTCGPAGLRVTAMRAAAAKQQTPQSPVTEFNKTTKTNLICSAFIKPYMTISDPIPLDHTYTSPTPGTRDTPMPSQNSTHNPRLQKTRRLDTTANSGASQGATHTLPTTTMEKRLQQMRPAHDIQPTNNDTHLEIMPMHHKHISKAQMYYKRSRGPNTVGYPCTKEYMAIPTDAQDPLRDTRSDKIIEKSTMPN